VSTDTPSPGQLWHQANGDAARYRELMRQHGHLIRRGEPGFDEASRTLPCGWPGPQKPADEWCIHDMPPGTCSHCTGRGEPVPDERDRAALGPPFTARYPGSCAWCGDRIREGDAIRRDGDRGYVCEGCAE